MLNEYELSFYDQILDIISEMINVYIKTNNPQGEYNKVSETN
ncbi:MAG: hypothetical protein N2Z71_00830 [Caloramator sp.]|nr:hypothetical protein [Caloramator sp.]